MRARESTSSALFRQTLLGGIGDSGPRFEADARLERLVAPAPISNALLSAPHTVHLFAGNLLALVPPIRVRAFPTEQIAEPPHTRK